MSKRSTVKGQNTKPLNKAKAIDNPGAAKTKTGLPIKNVYEDRRESKLKKFEPFKLETENPETVMLLLGSPEINVIISALSHLDTYCDQHPSNALILNDLHIIELILDKNLWSHDELFIKRFALKIICQILQIEDPTPAPISDYSIIEKLYDIARTYYLNTNTDDFVVEYSAVSLVGLMNEPRICILLENDTEFIKLVFFRLGDTQDPDILFQSYRILLRLLHCVTSTPEFCSIQNFPMESVLGDISSEYPDIQLAALQTIAELCDCAPNLHYQLCFVCAAFFKELFKVLEDNNEIKLPMLHIEVLEILRKLMKSNEIAKSFCGEGFLTRLIKYAKETDEFKLYSFPVLCEIAQHDELLDELLNVGAVEMLIDVYTNYCADINANICYGIKGLLKHPEACYKIIESDPIPCLLRTITDSLKDWETRDAALVCLQVLANRSSKICDNLYKNKFADICDSLLSKPYGDVPPDCIIHLTQILNAFVKYPLLRENIMNEKLAKSLVLAIKNSNRSAILTTNLLNCATGFICEETLQQEFLKNNIEDIFLPSLNSPAIIVKTAATDFIIVTGRLLKFSEAYIDSAILATLVHDEKALSICPTWSPAIEAILCSNPSLKFCMRGCLELTDKIDDDFYISKKHWNDFKTFRSNITEEVSPLYPLILVNFHLPDINESKLMHVECDNDSQGLGEWTYCRRPSDAYLPKYLIKLRKLLEIRGLNDDQTHKNCIDITKITDRAKIIAEIVVTEMCGDKRGIQSETCAEPVVLNHLHYLKCKLHCNIIPLGIIRFGGYFERSVLFKALADQIGLPCTLKRSFDGRLLYNEIPVPSQEENSKNGMPILPRRLLYPNHVVDIMDNPGELYPLDSAKANRYLHLI